MTLARYPNVQPNGSWSWLTIDSVRCSAFANICHFCTLSLVLQSTMRVVTRHGQVLDNQTFSVDDPQGRIAAWNATTGWLHGYWAFDWCAAAATHDRAPHSIAAFQG